MTYEPFRAALGVTNTELGTLLGITGFVQVFGYITLGWLQDMLQIRGIIMIDLIVYALLALSLALLPTPPFWWLCVVFAGFGLFGEALYWPTVQKATRGMSGPTHQAALFSTQEALRGAMGFIANLVTLLLFVTFGSQVIGVRMAMICYPLVMVALAYVVFHNVPADFLQKTPEMHEVATKRPRTSPGIVLTTLRSPIVWTTGLAAFAGYTAYIAVTTYALVLFQSTFSINDTYIAALGMINTGILPVVAALLSGWIARRFRSSSQWMTVLFVAAATLSFAVIPLSGSDTPYAGLIATGFLALCCYAIRAVYFVPIGEYDIDDAHAATVMSVASFLGYLPSFLAYQYSEPSSMQHRTDTPHNERSSLYSASCVSSACSSALPDIFSSNNAAVNGLGRHSFPLPWLRRNTHEHHAPGHRGRRTHSRIILPLRPVPIRPGAGRT